MRFLYDNISVFFVFLVVAVFAWLFGGIRGEYLVTVMPWLTAILLEVMFCFPQRHNGETTYEARERVWDDIKHDPLTWVSFIFFLLLLVPFFNKGLCGICDYPEIAAGADPAPPIPFFPFTVDRLEHLNVVLWFGPALACVVAVKHSLLKRGKCLLLEMIVWNGLLLGILGAVQQMTGAKGPFWLDETMRGAYFFSTFGYPNMAGDYFTTLFAISAGLWRWHLTEMKRELPTANSHHHSSEEDEGVHKPSFWKKHYLLIPTIIFYLCAIDTLSRASILLVTGLALAFFLHTFISFFSKMKRAQRVKAGALSVLILLIIAAVAVFCMPEDLQKEVDTINTTEVLDRVTGKGQYHVRVATEIWKDHLLFGVGGWGYKHFCIPYMTDKELRHIQQVGGINVHNDYLQFLAEHGTVGFGLLVAIVVMLIYPFGRIWRALVDSVRFIPTKKQPPQPVQIFVIPAPVFFIMLAVVATIIHSFGDCAMRSPAVLSLFFVELAAIDGFLPHVNFVEHESHKGHHHHASR